MNARRQPEALAAFHPAVQTWFTRNFAAPTTAQIRGWPLIARGDSTLIFAPTGSGKTLAAFLWCLDRLMFGPTPASRTRRCRVVYVSPLKSLAADIERNLHTPLGGIAHAADARGDVFVTPTIAIRTGDTSQSDRARFRRDPADVLITTPESLYLLLTSNARDALRDVETVILDEIHTLIPTKRGAHLALSLERLDWRCARLPQRIGLSATQRPLDEAARFLGGAVRARDRATERRTRSSSIPGERELGAEFGSGVEGIRYRPVSIVDGGARRALRLTIEVPPDSPDSHKPASAWAAIHPRLLELVRAHQSTLIFVNSRRLAERLAAALNELAGERLVRSHHGSLALAQRAEIEDALKAGTLRGLVATSSLELGIDMGAIDLVIQIEAPSSVSSALQRIGRSGHRIDAVSEGVIFPKFRGDLVASAAVAKAMHAGTVEASRYPRNPLDILAQQLVAMAAMDQWGVDDLYATVRRAAPFADLNRSIFDGVLDMLSGRYPSDEFAELRPRITWDRLARTVIAREGAKRVAIANGGTIPDRGLYGVFLAGASPGASRIGELDEEMVFETRIGETFVLGASSWRVEEMTHDRVLVSPAPGEPGKMPFWRGDRPGRPLDLGLAIGRLLHTLARLPPAAAVERLVREHHLDTRAAEILLEYVRDQASAGAVPDAVTVVIERVRDELGDWRLCVLSPRGGRIHAPWAMAVAARARDRTGTTVDVLWADDGLVARFPETDAPPAAEFMLPDPDEVQALVIRQLGATALFAAKFRENAARSLLLPKRRPGMRTPLWQQRKRAADLLAVAARYGSFPVLLETYRECLRDVFDMAALVATLRDIRRRAIRVVTIDSERPSPFAASLLFNYVASFLYDGDAPLAERRAQALSVDQSQLRALIGEAELRDLLDAEAMGALERQLQRLEPTHHARSVDGIHDMLLSLGDLTADEVGARTGGDAGESLSRLLESRRVLAIPLAGESRVIAVEHASRYRDAFDSWLPPDLPEALLEPVRDPLGDIALRYARTHAPFTAALFAARYGLPTSIVEETLARLATEQKLVEGEFRPDGKEREWTDAGVLRLLRRRSLARLRREVEPVDQVVLGRFLVRWQGISKRRRSADGLLDAIEQLQGAPLTASILETELLPARIDAYDPSDLDALMAAGEVVWVGIEPLGDRDGRVALFLGDRTSELLVPEPLRVRSEQESRRAISGREKLIADHLRARGASFFGALHEAAGGGYPAETVLSLWNLVWQGVVTNDTLHALRAFSRAEPPRRRERLAAAVPRGPKRLAPPSAEGRWSLVGDRAASTTSWVAGMARQLLSRHGVLTREAVMAESIPGGFSLLYSALKAMEESGRIRRGYFVAGLGASQFALPGALELLRSLRGSGLQEGSDDVASLAATDPANPYGAILRWPDVAPSTNGVTHAAEARKPTRSVGARVILVDGALVAYLPRGERQLLTWIPDAEPERGRVAAGIARALMDRARGGSGTPRGMLIQEIDGRDPSAHPLAPFLRKAGFISGALGFQATHA